jgi:hypothetical protein
MKKVSLAEKLSLIHEHWRPKAEVLVFEPAETRNTGNIVDQTFTAPNGVMI